MAARVVIAGSGLRSIASGRFPPGVLYGGGYDPATNTLYLAGPGHPQGVAAGGGDASAPRIPGISMFRRDDGAVYWANDSWTLHDELTEDEALEVQLGLESQFTGVVVAQLVRITDVPAS